MLFCLSMGSCYTTEGSKDCGLDSYVVLLNKSRFSYLQALKLLVRCFSIVVLGNCRDLPQVQWPGTRRQIDSAIE